MKKLKYYLTVSTEETRVILRSLIELKNKAHSGRQSTRTAWTNLSSRLARYNAYNYISTSHESRLFDFRVSGFFHTHT